ncbi:MAG: hypothetical protein UR28_C0027G0003 [Candidatus Peregrinibacteria bacterium GW2011_GWF2_33_10]|nr:MAG: hypothetical protein UR28_C0027G0003 [Candidatus Peregrinibacteria bacterium GW2011_GWF2_33_10]OGJ44858.1 MAG: antirepressor [Candidatus Peregrinibacteria bacterium RIFOXYA2_FULL_33_21]OGJ47143.1 MAG: antirepressor [Candidatus Peregrinibacteria bacterium RIFOXYA12_FULL_33_12]OGJ50544.1 MAG: antirepressor [Candidatus Peregrinibacteria bacterium RIFOXYB2_FULL_33_20]
MSKLAIFDGKKIRRYWDSDKEKWYFSVVDVVGVLSNSSDPRNYWKVLKMRLKSEGNQTVTNCNQLKLLAEDGKMRKTDVADTETLFRVIQSIPSSNAEPFKLWLAKVGHERVQETDDPELALDRAMKTYLQKGYSKEWINQRLKSIEIRKELTDEWEKCGVKENKEFAILTDEITFAWAGLHIKDYKKHKNLKTENLRDNMTNLELVLNMLAEATTTEISKEVKPKIFEENKKVAKEGGQIVGNTRKEIENKTGKKVISASNMKLTKQLNK